MSKIEIKPEIVQAYLELVLAEMSEESYTAYGVAVVLNRILVVNGNDKVRPQMMYNYARNGLIVKGEKIFGPSLREFTKIEVAEFVIRYCLKHEIEIKFVHVNADQLELDLDAVK